MSLELGLGFRAWDMLYASLVLSLGYIIYDCTSRVLALGYILYEYSTYIFSKEG